MTNSHQPWRSLSLLVILSLIIFPQTATRTAGASMSDEQGIQKLHQQDMDATLSSDPQALADLFTEDAVLLEPGSPAVIGKAAILAGNKKEQAEHPGVKIMSCKPDIRDTQVVEGWAYE